MSVSRVMLENTVHINRQENIIMFFSAFNMICRIKIRLRRAKAIFFFDSCCSQFEH